MTDTTTPSANGGEPTDVRFSIRSLLIAMALVAVAAAALGPFFRSLPGDQRGPAALLWGLTTVMVSAILISKMRTRIRLEKFAGRKLMELPPRSERWATAPAWLRFIGGLLLIAAGLFYLLLMTSANSGPAPLALQIGSAVIPSIISGLTIATGITRIWWNRAVQLRENGVLYGTQLLPWSHITSCRWIVSAAIMEGLDDRHRDFRIGMSVPANLRGDAERIFAERVGQSPAFHDSLALSPATASIPRFRIYSPGERRARGCLMMFLAYMFCGALFGFLLRSQPREFQYGCFPGIVATIVYIAFRSRRCQQAGAPRVRVRASTDWRGVFIVAGPAAAVLYLSYEFPFSLGWATALIGFGVAAALVLVFAREWRGHVDLCENGIVTSSWMYWPWSQVRLCKWNRTGNGRLVFSRGWQRTVAVVPTPHTEEVDALLKEKLRI